MKEFESRLDPSPLTLHDGRGWFDSSLLVFLHQVNKRTIRTKRDGTKGKDEGRAA